MRKIPDVSGIWHLAFVLLLAACVPVVGSLRALSQTGDRAAVPSTGSQPPFQLKVKSNLVIVRVVVRDADGKPVKALQKEDFKVLDRGKEQSILQFEVETSTPPLSSSAAVGAPGQAAPPPSPAKPGKFLALYFDNLNTADADMIYTREAADHYLTANLQPTDRVAIFTSEKMLSDFTADPQQIHAALAKLQSSARSISRIHDCLDLSDYQALEITQQENPENSNAWQIALDEAAKRCHLLIGPPSDGSTDSSQGDSPAVATIRASARSVVLQSEMQARSNLQELDRVVNYIARMPGQRTIILVSPGFLSQSAQYPLDRLIDDAVRSQVVISSLDPRGLAVLMRTADASRDHIAGLPGATDRLDTARELVAADVLAEVAQGTGGEFFHNNNDLKGGFGALAGSPVNYLLSFAPANLKQDGGFHALKVKLVEKNKGFSVQARRGYFAPKNEAEAAAEAKQQAASDSEAKSQEQMREAMFSKADSQQLPVGLGGKLSEGQGGTRQLSLFTHLDTKPLHFQKDGEHNLNTVTFVFAVFDEKDNLVTARQSVARLSVLDGELPGLLKDGVNVKMNFDLKPGTYRIREVVTDSEDHLTAHSTTIKVP
jgi:VWFA-related protein